MKVPKTADTYHCKEAGDSDNGAPLFSGFSDGCSNRPNFFISGSMKLTLGVLESYARALFKNSTHNYRVCELHRSLSNIPVRCEFP